MVRNALREGLKELGFVGWQQSVMVSKADVTNELRELIRKSGLEDYTLIIETEDLGNGKLKSLLDKVG